MTNYFKLFFILIAVPIFFLQCEECPVCAPCNSEQEISIYAILDASSNFQRVMVSRVMDNEYADEIFINDLDVRISGFPLEPRPNLTTFLDRRYFHYEEDANYLGPLTLSPGDSAFIQIFRNGSLAAQGYTMIPNSLDLKLDETDQILKWGEGIQPNGGQGLSKQNALNQLEPAIFTIDAYKRTGPGIYDTLLTNHFVSENSFTLNDTLFQLSGFYRYKVTAYDVNYYNHKFLDSTRAGLELGYGLIGSKFSEVVDHFPPK